MAGAWHPLVAHLVGTVAVELLSGSFSLRLGIEHRLLGAVAGLLSAGGSRTNHGHEATNGCERDDYPSLTGHGVWDNSIHLGRGRRSIYAVKCPFAKEPFLSLPSQRRASTA